MGTRTLHRLSPNAVRTQTKPGRHADGGGLYLSISSYGRRRWVFMFARGTKQSEIGLGGARDVTLAKAREIAAAMRAALRDGKDPRSVRRVASPVTFGEFADDHIEHKVAPSLRNAKHLDQWRMTLREYAKPMRGRPIDAIDTDDVLGVLKPIWTSKNETAVRLRGRIEAILDAAKAKGLRSGENPARWRGHLDHLLPKRQKLTRGHHAALPFADIPTFMADLRSREGVAALALEFAILTAARSGEVRGARWDEFDFDKAIWTVPPERMKAGIVHRVPLSRRAVAIVQKLQEAKTSEFVFPGRNGKTPMSDMTLTAVLKRMKCAITAHGFRSSFRDWCGEATNFPREIAEAALAHTNKNEVEAAYRRGDALEKRRELMTAWTNYCEKDSVNVH
ncbi:tyrosine-type recombinase/integrase [Pseudorhodoplanes sinuspersici]|uniref:Integrase n=1 Tax=Pseudorhodoplanes sinuspersici TaxID=1235591 RepID=A0A1W6ZWG6_9HYPH|nr:site-specific integrase [Pseudorhodoplanes sinuspersici]ARQ01712.1 integrase [Pseudorhodoplanes sinuspersici]RKE73446.1 integrase [Pseudorhodoplanes sinuspersici]